MPLPIGENMAGKSLKQPTARMAKPPAMPDSPAREPSAAVVIAKRIEEDIVGIVAQVERVHDRAVATGEGGQGLFGEQVLRQYGKTIGHGGSL